MSLRRAHAPVLQALNYIDEKLAREEKTFGGSVRARLEEDVEGSVTRLLTAALKQTLHAVLCSIDQAATHDVSALESCLKLLGVLTEENDVANALTVELGGAAVVGRALRAHPQNLGVVNEAMWALAQLEGVVPCAQVLCDVRLQTFAEPVRASLRALAHLPQCRYQDLESALPWSDRWQMAQAVVGAMSRFGDDTCIRGLGCAALGSLLASWAPDVVHSETAKVLPVLFQAMRSALEDADLQYFASYATAIIVPGNALAAAVACEEQNAATLAEVMQRHGSSQRIRRNLVRIVMSLQGVQGILVAAGILDDQAAHSDMLWALGQMTSGDRCDRALAADAIRCIVLLAQRWGARVHTNGVAAVHKLLLLLVEQGELPAPLHDAASLAFGYLLDVLHLPHFSIPSGLSLARTTGFRALAEVAQLSPWAHALLCQLPRLKEALGWWRLYEKLDAEAEAMLYLDAVLHGSIEPISKAMNEYPNWQDLQLAACIALGQLAKADEDDQNNMVRRAAPTLCQLTGALLRRFPHAWASLRVAAAALYGHVLGALEASGSPEAGAMLTQGCEDLVTSIRFLHKRSVPQRFAQDMASDTCRVLRAISAVALECPATQQLFRAADIVPLLAEVTQELATHASSLVLSEALLTLGLLGGAGLVGEAMTVFRKAYWVQVAGVMALNSLARSGFLKSAGDVDLSCISGVIQQAMEEFKNRQNAALHSQATVTMKLVEIACT